MKPFIAMALTAALAAGGLAGCLGGAGEREVFNQAGSSTVLPVARAWAEEFDGAEFVVEGGGSGAGFQKFCRGEIDVADASRAIKPDEVAACDAKGISPFEVEVGIDGLAVVVSKDNDFVDHLTVSELHRMWTANDEAQANRWSDLRPDWPDAPIVLFGPGTDSGTFDYFVEVIIQPTDGKETKGRSDYTPSEDDNVLVQGVARSPNGLGYFGLAYAVKNEDKVRIVPIDAERGAGPVAPTAANVASGAYSPLSRPLFMYSDGAPTGTLLEYFVFGLGPEGQGLVDEVGYIKLPTTKATEMLAKVRGG